MSLLLKACAQQTELSEIHLAGRNYGMNNELKLWKGPHSPLYTGNYGHRIIFFYYYFRYVLKHMLDSNKLYVNVNTLVVKRGWLLLAMDILNQNRTSV